MAMRPVSPDDPTIGKLVKDASRDISTIVRKEIQLAKSELKVSFNAGTTGLGFFAVAGFLALLAVILLSISFGYFLVWAGLGPHWAFLIITGVYLLVAAVLAWLGWRKVRRAKLPERAIAQAREVPKALTPGS